MTHRTYVDEPSLSARAADWYARVRGGQMSEVDAARFRAWLANPAHRREFEDLDQLWDDLSAIEGDADVHAELAASAPASSSRRSALGWALAASMLLAIGVAAFWVQRPAGTHYVTAVGEQRTVPLEDGSVVTLNTASELRVNYTATARTVELVGGQATFEVAKDPARPFVVQAGPGHVKALGTVFDVYKTGDNVVVTLIEGKVAVVPEVHEPLSRAEPGASGSGVGSADVGPGAQVAGLTEGIVLTAGQQLTYTRTAVGEPVAADIRRVLAWRARKLDFADTPLSAAIVEANRYSRVKIALRAPGLENVRISGVFEAGRNDLFAEGLESFLGLKAQRVGDDLIVLTHGTH
ncbi:MAG: FecR domain-containing protein [Steroidobacteraceae bacterium]|nr:FecR domain-containing protein [Steroidobacteraceae bacterium]